MSMDDNEIAEEIESVRVTSEMEQSYLDYSMSVIAGRALPDVRDGLKPVQRRILYAMHEEGISSSGSHRKSSSVVGNTMGNYHPHGDKSIYDALVRMSQDFSLRYPIVDGQGNFGSIDGDPPAAMRYTEARLSEFGELLLENISENTVDWTTNYDGRMEEPEVLPASFPNLLVNGSKGIAVGMSTNIPPHNLTEIIDATIHTMENPDCEVTDLLEYVDGPDFPTGANVVEDEQLIKAYTTGKGKMTIRASYEIEDRDSTYPKIIVKEIPYRKNKEKLVKKIADLVNEGRLEGIRDIRDESNREGIRIVIELKRDGVVELVENQLIDKVLEKSSGIINLALVDGQPRILNLKQMIEHFIEHRREVILRRSEYRLDEAEDRAHILEGRLKALENIDETVDVIQDSEDRSSAISHLITEFELTETQAEHIVRMQLGSLTSMEKTDINEEYEEVNNTIEELTEIINNTQRLDEVVKEELEEVRAEYGDERRTSVVSGFSSVEHEDLIPEEEVYLFMTENGYVKTTSADEFGTQNRGGKGVIGMSVDSDSDVLQVVGTSTHNNHMVFTDTGKVYSVMGYELPNTSRTAKGSHIRNYIPIDEKEQVTHIQVVKEEEESGDLLLATRDGYVKRTPMDEYNNIRHTGIKAINLGETDVVVDGCILTDENYVMVNTKKGMATRFSEDDLRRTGRTSQGVYGIEVGKNDKVVNVSAASEEQSMLTITENGYGKLTGVSEYRVQSRYGKGVIDIKTEEGFVTDAGVCDGDENILVCTSKGNIIKIDVGNISEVGRNTKGVKVMETEESSVTSISILN